MVWYVWVCVVGEGGVGVCVVYVAFVSRRVLCVCVEMVVRVC